MTVPQLLLETLQGLRKDDFETLKWYLSMDILEGCTPIPVSSLENAPRTNTVSRMIESYGEESAVKVTVAILRKMRNNNAADGLEKRFAAPPAGPVAPPAGPVAPPAGPVAPPAGPVAPPAAPTTMAAQHGSGIIAPTITGSNIGTLNITYK